MAITALTHKNFQDEVYASDKPVLIDFYAPWCGPCRALSHIVDEIADELSGEVKIGKVNIDEERELASAFRIASIPTLVVVKGGKLTATAVGARPKGEILKMLKD